MIVELIGETTFLKVKFLDEYSFKNIYESKELEYRDYEAIVQTQLSFSAYFTNFFNNLPIESVSEEGVGQIGNNFRGNKVGSRIVEINFKNVFTASDNGYSPNQIVSTLVNDPTEVIDMYVSTDEENIYSMKCHATDDTSTEEGILILESAYPNDGSFWNGGIKKETEYFLEQYPLIPKELPQIMLKNDWYPLKKDILVETDIPLNISFGGEIHGEWQKINIKTNRGIEFSYDNKAPFKGTIFINYEDRTILNQDGEDVSGNITMINGQYPFIILYSGINSFEVTVDDYLKPEDLYLLPTDMNINFEYLKLVSSIGMEESCLKR